MGARLEKVGRLEGLIDLKGCAATAAGAALLPMPLVIAMTAPMMGRLAASFGPRLPLATALASAILVAHAQGLQSAFHLAMLVGAATAAAACALAFL